ncbi:SRPBCC domain-containing protein [Dyella sp. EPa41]|uniref:SRPBCC family protein n=1 Tax=Dyella sp. EPa41 TaxID=1561194 RepID=UPI001914EF3A|nr:SRPBCC domain-containing protein [Dyella sp. EPa41]
MQATIERMTESLVPERFTEVVQIAAPVAAVWNDLVSSEHMGLWMGDPSMDVRVETTWRVGSRFVVRGVHHVPFENSGVLLALEPMKRLAYSHRSSLSGLPERPSSYTTLDFAMEGDGDGTLLSLSATGFPSASIYHHLRFYWAGTLEVFKRYVESRA